MVLWKKLLVGGGGLCKRAGSLIVPTDLGAAVAATIERKCDAEDVAHDAPKDYATASPRVRLSDAAGLREAFEVRGHAVLEDVAVTAVNEAQVDALLEATANYRAIGPEMAIGKFVFPTAVAVEHRFRNGRLEPSDAFQDLARRLATVARRVVEALDPALLPYADDALLQQQEAYSTCVFRVYRYERGARDLHAHTDDAFVTLVPATAVPGLLVFDPSLKVWLRPNDGLVALPGNLLDLLTAGKYAACVHRVLPPDRRYSTPLLLRANHARSFAGVPMYHISKALRSYSSQEGKALVENV